MKTRMLRETALAIAVEAKTRMQLISKEPPKKSKSHLRYIHKSLTKLVALIIEHQTENRKKRKLNFPRKVVSRIELSKETLGNGGKTRQNSAIDEYINLDKLNFDLRIKRITNTLLAQKSRTSEKTIRRILDNQKVKQSTLDRFYCACDDLGYKRVT